jgi:two-component sensor histidine kinase
MVLLDLKAHFLFGMMLGEMGENAANHAFSSREFNKTSLLFYNDYYRSKVMRL